MFMLIKCVWCSVFMVDLLTNFFAEKGKPNLFRCSGERSAWSRINWVEFSEKFGTHSKRCICCCIMTWSARFKIRNKCISVLCFFVIMFHTSPSGNGLPIKRIWREPKIQKNSVQNTYFILPQTQHTLTQYYCKKKYENNNEPFASYCFEFAMDPFLIKNVYLHK